MTTFTIEVKDEAVQALLAKLSQRAGGLSPVLQALGSDITEGTKRCCARLRALEAQQRGHAGHGGGAHWWAREQLNWNPTPFYATPFYAFYGRYFSLSHLWERVGVRACAAFGS
jgi:hypothetical protein